MKTILLFIMAGLLLMSCQKEPVTGEIELTLVWGQDDLLTKEEFIACKNKKPELMIIELRDKDSREYITTPVDQLFVGSYGMRGHKFELPEGRYMVISVTIIDEYGNVAFEMKPEGYSSYQVAFTPFYFGIAPGEVSKLGLDCFCKLRK